MTMTDALKRRTPTKASRAGRTTADTTSPRMSTTGDVRNAADVLLLVHDASNGP
ncbi:hypothetical protein AB0D08_37540 [Kitasatospora sp. NPDC048540]|uniref:hypothetical protein n=1 Tax=Kitasatospora sp. NPDC048540 TaxID=3155634 RepID=UPI0033C392F5